MNEFRMSQKCGMVAIFEALVEANPEADLDELHKRLNTFYHKLMVNRHKVEVLTPSIHITTYSCDGARFDLRPHVYNPKLSHQ